MYISTVDRLPRVVYAASAYCLVADVRTVLSPYIIGEMHPILLSVRFVFMTSLSRVQSNGR
jgi:hypothetical protein